MRPATETEERQLLEIMGAMEPVQYLCIDQCGRLVADGGSRCIRCENSRRRAARTPETTTARLAKTGP